MKTIRLFWIIGLLMALGAVREATADRVVLSRNGNVYAKPDRNSDVLEEASTGAAFALNKPTQENGYYEIRTQDGRTGYIYRTLVRRYADNAGGAEGAATIIPAGRLQVHVINVGQADAIYIRCPDGRHQMLIDAGDLDIRYPNSARRFKAFLQESQPRRDPIEVVIATHPHSDHIGSLPWVLMNYSVKLYVDNGESHESGTYRLVDQALIDREIPYWSALDEVMPEIDFCPDRKVTARLIRPKGYGDLKNPNDDSVIVRVDYLESSFLFVGDAEKELEAMLLEDESVRDLLDVDFLKVGHHGSDTSSSERFLEAVTPDIAAISCGEPDTGTNKGYRHPRLETVNELLKHIGPRPAEAVTVPCFSKGANEWRDVVLDRAVYVTSVEGDLLFESDGQSISYVEAE